MQYVILHSTLWISQSGSAIEVNCRPVNKYTRSTVSKGKTVRAQKKEKAKKSDKIANKMARIKQGKKKEQKENASRPSSLAPVGDSTRDG
jgi:hypothetical protein